MVMQQDWRPDYLIPPQHTHTLPSASPAEAALASLPRLPSLGHPEPLSGSSVTSVASMPSPPFSSQPTRLSLLPPGIGLVLPAPSSRPPTHTCTHTCSQGCCVGPPFLSSVASPHPDPPDSRWVSVLCAPPRLAGPGSLLGLFAFHTTHSSPGAPGAICPCPGLCSECKTAPEKMSPTRPGHPPTLGSLPHHLL